MDRPVQTRVKAAGFQPVQALALLIGLVFLAFGIIGLTITGFGGFADPTHSTLWNFSINPFLCVVYLVVGVLGLIAALNSGVSRTFGWLMFAGLGLLVVWGLAITGVFADNPVSGLGNPLALNTADNWLNFGGAVASLLVAVLPARKKVVQTAEPGATTEPPRQDAGEPAGGRGHRRRLWHRRSAHTS
ncbi:DUF4383 domain-containing protein [Prauserella muralis]|uniref:Uncharacterized protein n=1 Tax=Prauserella muralis TaxID=588067 RepID=A0A2V4AZM3_9PSEU|nr:DUF4383 domain-containing protein [Prauserella muralis]PXY27217.1 hypothetical protein BAY60_12190 [Prauserella muralis]TWE23127.1 uncharacterized protein DUF4383 [Prauserella muralis]